MEIQLVFLLLFTAQLCMCALKDETCKLETECKSCLGIKNCVFVHHGKTACITKKEFMSSDFDKVVTRASRCLKIEPSLPDAAATPIKLDAAPTFATVAELPTFVVEERLPVATLHTNAEIRKSVSANNASSVPQNDSNPAQKAQDTVNLTPKTVHESDHVRSSTVSLIQVNQTLMDAARKLVFSPVQKTKHGSNGEQGSVTQSPLAEEQIESVLQVPKVDPMPIKVDVAAPKSSSRSDTEKKTENIKRDDEIRTGQITPSNFSISFDARKTETIYRGEKIGKGKGSRSDRFHLLFNFTVPTDFNCTTANVKSTQLYPLSARAAFNICRFSLLIRKLNAKENATGKIHFGFLHKEMEKYEGHCKFLFYIKFCNKKFS